MKSFVTLFAITIIALLIWWGQTDNNKKDSSITSDPHYVDTFMRDFTLTAMNDKGKPDFTLKASYMEHFHDNDNALITKPVFHLLQAGVQWVITAQRGKINTSHNRVVFQGNVVMQQENTDNPIQLKTELLKINTKKQLAKSNQTVHIRHGGLHLESKGMIFDNKTGQLELLAKVSGVYASAK